MAGFAAILGVTVIAYGFAATTTPHLYLAPSTMTAATGATVSLVVHEDPASNSVNGVQAELGYDKTQLQFAGFTESGPFTQVLSSDGNTAGIVRFARGTPLGTSVTGDNAVVTLKFKVLASSGTPAVSFNDANSGIASSTTNANIMSFTQGATITVSSTGPPPAVGRLSLAPATMTAKQGDTITLSINEDSSTTFVSGVQFVLNYDKAKLQYSNISEGTVFPVALSTNTSTAGSLAIARGVPLATSVSGQNLVVRVSFKVLATTGTTTLNFDQSQSHIATSADAADILGGVSGSTVTVTSVPPSNSALFSMSPASGTYQTGATIPVTVNANGGSAALSVAEPIITYPSNQLQFVSVTDNSVFPLAMRTNSSTLGKLDLIRGISGGSLGVTGTNPVTVVNFKVIGSSGSAALAFTAGSALYDTSGSGTNLLDLANSHGATYNIGGTPTPSPSPSPSPSPTPSPPPPNCSGNPSAPGTPTAGTVSYTSVNLTWAASTPANNCTLGGYHVFRDGSAVGTVTNVTNFQDTGLSLNTAYHYTVQAFDTAGHLSPMSTSATITTKADNQAPTAPTGVSAVSNTPAAVNLSWTASNDLPNPGGVGVAGYHIYRDNDTTPTYTVNSGTTFTDSNVTAGTAYHYTVTAFDKAGNESSPSNIVAVTTPTPSCSGTPSVPGGLAVTSVGLTSASFSWNASTATDGCQIAGYHVYRGATLVGTVTDTSFTDNSLTPNTIYAYSVKAFDSSAHSSTASAPLLVTTTADTQAPNAPSSVTAVATSAGQVTLTWSAATDNVAVTGYRVYRNGTKVASLGGSVLSYSDVALSQNTDYTYEVTAVDGAGNESPKAAADPSPVHTPGSSDTQAPTAPGGVHTLAVTSSTIAFGWDASTDDTGVLGYRVYRGSTLLGVVTVDSFADTGLTADTQYTYTVKAFDAAGNLSQPSVDFTVSTLAISTGSLVGDLNGDGKVDVYDLSILLTNWEQSDVPPTKGDLNQDNVVNFVDLVILLLNYGEGA